MLSARKFFLQSCNFSKRTSQSLYACHFTHTSLSNKRSSVLSPSSLLNVSKRFASEELENVESTPSTQSSGKRTYLDRVDKSFTFSEKDQYHNPLEKYEMAAESCAQIGDYEGVLKICEELRQPTFRVLNALLRSYVYVGMLGKIPDVFDQLKQYSNDEGGGIVNSYTILLEHYIRFRFYKEARNVFAHMEQEDIVIPPDTLSSFIQLYFENGAIDEAIFMVQCFQHSHTVSQSIYDTFLGHLWSLCDDPFFYQYFKKYIYQLREGLQRELPYDFYEYLARAAAHNGNCKEAFLFYDSLLEKGMNIDPFTTHEVLNCLLDNFGGRTKWLRKTLFRSALRGIRIIDNDWNASIHYFSQNGDHDSVLYAYRIMKRDVHQIHYDHYYTITQSILSIGTPDALQHLPELVVKSPLPVKTQITLLEQLIDIDLNQNHPLDLSSYLSEIYEHIRKTPEYHSKIKSLMIDYQLSKGNLEKAVNLLQSSIEYATTEGFRVQLMNDAKHDRLSYEITESGKPVNMFENITKEQLKELDPEGVQVLAEYFLRDQPLPTWEDLLFGTTSENPILNDEGSDFVADVQKSAERFYNPEDFSNQNSTQTSEHSDYLDVPDDTQYQGNYIRDYAQYLPRLEELLSDDLGQLRYWSLLYSMPPQSEGNLDSESDFKPILLPPPTPYNELKDSNSSELETEDDDDANLNEELGETPLPPPAETPVPFYDPDFRNYIKANSRRRDLQYRINQQEHAVYTDLINNNEQLGKLEFLEVSSMWRNVVVFALAHHSPQRAFDIVHSILNKIPMAHPPSMTVLNLIAEGYKNTGALDKIAEMFKTLRVRPSLVSVSYVIDDFLANNQFNQAYDQFCSFVMEFSAVPSIPTLENLVQYLVRSNQPIEAITVLENAAHLGVRLPENHFNSVLNSFIDREEYDHAATVAADSILFLQSSNALEKLIQHLVKKDKTSKAIEYVSQIMAESESDLLLTFTPMVSLFRSKGLQSIADHISKNLETVRQKRIESMGDELLDSNPQDLGVKSISFFDDLLPKDNTKQKE